ncbi:glutamate formiminotransferase / formiminotetrahydrofolate cyclodeaminase [Thermoflexales bacterium]|nr:glutamate formiminotransferase / formiminotetrahydrofolate cyclodeaminase [Thermoflexales bacterium]
MAKIVECVPNFSEARRPEVVAQIRSAVAAIAGVTFLDQHSDVDHNRTVLTFVGEPEAVERAAFDAIKTAAQLIDLGHHTGEHPRLGATDVVPFVPISGVTLEECVAMAKRLGERVGQELSIPVYLYEAAATRPDRENLENIRRGQYEGLKTEIESNPDRLPDYGPAKLGPAGATVIGARSFLIAFNVYLNTGDVEIARKIAKTVRHSSGGLRYVKAAGFLVEGQAQVSMNLTNYRKTPLARVVETIRREAARYGCAITKSELVGLTPQDALTDAAQWYLQLDLFESQQILENKLRETMSGQPKSIVPHAFIEATAAGSATPGGGAVAALAGALAAALAGMVARLTIGKKKYAAVETKMKDIAARADGLRDKLTASIDEDSAAFQDVMNAMKLPKETPDEITARTAQIQSATKHATLVPLHTARLCLEALGLIHFVAANGNLNAMSDAASGAFMARAAIDAAGMNVRINAATLDDKAQAQRYVDELKNIQAQALLRVDQVLAEVEKRATLA